LVRLVPHRRHRLAWWPSWLHGRIRAKYSAARRAGHHLLGLAPALTDRSPERHRGARAFRVRFTSAPQPDAGHGQSPYPAKMCGGAERVRAQFGHKSFSARSGARKCLILKGEMSEWLKEHAWKWIPPARADAHRNALTQFPATTFRNNDVLRHISVNDGVCPGGRGLCDKLLTLNRAALYPGSAHSQGGSSVRARG
jgi:hypothetical protein